MPLGVLQSTLCSLAPQEGGNTLVLSQVTSVRDASKSKRETHRLRVEEGDVDA